MPFPLSASKKIYVDSSNIGNAGRGTFAKQDIAAGEVIETSPVLALESQFIAWWLRITPLRNYFYQWGQQRKKVAFALGFGSLYNHTYDPNAEYEKKLDQEEIVFTARRDIKKGEEITINYNGHPEDKSDLWDDTISDSDDA